MALGRISGPLLKSNLTRDGVDLAFETDLLYLDVTNGRIGINTSTPVYELEVVGTLKASVYRMDELNIGNGVITGNVVVTDGYWKTLIGDLHMQAEPVTGKIIFDSNTKVNGNLEVTGDITLGGTINIGNFNDDLVIFNGEIGSNFIPDITNTYNIGSSSKRWNDGYYKTGYIGNISIGTNTIQASNTNGSITLTPNGSGTVVVSGTTALQIPAGTEASKSGFTPAVGQIRLNTTTSQFEGYANSNWTSLGGVRSVDNLTYITAELTPGASDDTIRFYTNGAIRGSIDSAGLALNAAETIKFYDQDNSAYVSVKSPDVVDSSYIIKLPASQPITRSVLSNDGAGNTSWTSSDESGGNRVYVSPTNGNDSNDGVNAPVKTLKKGLQIASGLSYVPTVDPTVGFYNAKRLLEANRSYIQAETIAWIDFTYPSPGFIYDKTKCSRDVGQIIDAVVYDIILGGNRRTVEAGQSYLSVALVMGAEKTQTLAAINFARDLAVLVIQNLSPVTAYQSAVSQVKYDTLPGTTAVSSVTSKFNVVYGIINTGSSPTIVQPAYKIIPITVYVASGDFYIDNPVIVPDNVSVVGDSLRSVVVRPTNANKDMFRVRNGAYLTGITLRDGLDGSLVPNYKFSWAVAFDDPLDTTTDRIGYTYLANTKPIITLSPYIQNCSIISFLGANGVWVDGSKVITPNVPANNIEAENPVNLTNGIPEQGKSMVGNAFTMLSFGGTGWLITNDAYAQLVSCFQIFMLNGTYTQSGGYISITNSATNFGLYALRSSGYSPNSFTFDRGYIVSSGSSGGSVTLTSIGTKREPVNQYVLRIRDATTDTDITSSFKHATSTKSFNAATGVNVTTNIITISSHGFSTGDAVYYSNGGNADVLGLLNNELYYVSVLSSSTFVLYHDNSLSYAVDILATGTGTHQLLSNVEEFYIGKTVETHTAYQELTLTSGVYSFVAGQQILGLTSSVQNTAYAFSYNPATYKLIVSNEYSIVSGNPQRILFAPGSTITSIGGSGVSIAVTAAQSIVNTYYTSTFTVTSTISGNQLLTPSNTILQKINFHRPSIVNSSAHTWEFAGSGTDYNALPQNGGVSKGTAYEQYSELPGRVYTSGTNELGDFKVGDFIVAENKTGDITFKTQVTIGELSILKLSLSSVEVTEFSTDTSLGDNEPGGPSNSRISVQKAVRSFIANRLGKVLDKEVSTNSVPGSLVQLNASGQINQDLLPPSRGVTTYSVTGWGNRVTLSEKIPSISVISGDNASETYVQRTLDLNTPITVVQGDIITQVGNTGYGIAKVTGTFGSIALVNTTGTFDLSSDLKINGTTQTGIHPTISYATVNIVDNYYLKTDSTSQFLILYPGITYDFTGVTVVTGANSSAQGQITSGPIYGVAYSVDITTLIQGSLYTPASGSVIYYNVPLTNVSGSGTGAKADITVTNGKVVAVAITSGGSGYVAGNVVSANAADIGGTGSGFSVSILRADTRLYVDLLGTYVKFVASQATPEYIEDATATTTSIPDLTAFVQKNFDARDVTSGGNVDYALSTITITSHTLSDGDAVLYSTGGNPVIGNMINSKTYWVKVVNSNTIELYTNYSFTSGSKVIFGSSSTGVHNFKRYAINTNSNTVYAVSHGLTTGQSIRFTAATPPGGLVSNNYYFIGSVTTNSFTLHTVKTDALASYNGITAGSVTLSSTGSGSATITKQNVQVIGTTNTSSADVDNWGVIAQSTIDAVNIVSGTVNTSRLGSIGTANNATFLRGDSSWQYAVQNIRAGTSSPLTVTGSYYTVGPTNYYYNSLLLDIDRASDTLGDVTYTNLGVAGFNKSQFTVTTGNVTVKTGVIDAGLLGGNSSTYYTNPANIVGQVSVAKGGTGLSTVTKGDLLYSGATGSLTQLNIGAASSILTSDGNVPYWSSTLSLTGAVVTANSSTPAFRITQTGTGNALVVEDSSNPDSTPFVIDANGNVGIGTTTPTNTLEVVGSIRNIGADHFIETNITGTGSWALGFQKSRGTNAAKTAVVSGDILGQVSGQGYDGTSYQVRAAVRYEVDGAVSTSIVPTAITFRTGTTTTSERVRIRSDGKVVIGTNSSTSGSSLLINKDLDGAGVGVDVHGVYSAGVIKSDVQGFGYGFKNRLQTEAATFVLSNYYHYSSEQFAIGSGSTITNQYGFYVDSSLTGATNNYGVYSNIASAANRWNIYANGTAQNYFSGNTGIGAVPSGSYKLEVTGSSYFSSNVTVNGDLVVNGNTTTVNSTTLTVDDKNIELGAVVAISNVSGTIAGTATTTTITGITSTSGMIPGQALTKVSGTGAFGGVTTITSVDSLTQITITSTTANTAGAIVFNVGGATDVTANGGGITLKGATDKTIIYDNTNTRWQTNVSLGVNGSLTVGTGSAAATITSQGTQNLILNTNSGTNSGSIVINQGTNGNIDIEPNGTGDVNLKADTVVVGDLNTASIVTTNGTSNITINTNSGTNSGSLVINNGANGNVDITANGTGNVNVVSPTINLGTSTSAATTVKVGGAITGNTLKIAGTAAGTINLTTDVTTGAVSVFPSLTTATMTIGSANAGTVAIAFNKASTTTTSGALTVAGGVGIAGDLYTRTLTIPAGPVNTFTVDPNESTNKIFAVKVFPTVSYDAASLATGDSVTVMQMSALLSPTSNPVGTLFGYGIFGSVFTDPTNAQGYASYDIRGIYGNVYHKNNSNLIKAVGVAGRAWNQGTGTIDDAIAFYARNPRNDSTGVITRATGLYIDNITTGVDNYAIYSLGGKTYLAGNTGIGASPSGSYKLEVTGSSYFSSNVTVNGDLIVNGNTTTVNSTTLAVDDKNIELGAVVAISNVSGTISGTATTTTITGITSTSGMIPGQALTKVSGTGAFGGVTTITSVDSLTQITITSATANTAGAIVFNVGGATDTTADSGGITLKGATDKTFTYVNSSTSWTSNQNLDIATGKTYKIATIDVLSASAVLQNATTATLAGSATTLGIGGSSGTLTIGNATITGTNATTLNLNGASPSVVTSSTGTASVFNTNALTGNLFGAATTVNIGGANVAFNIGTTAGNSTVTINGSGTGGTAIITTNVTSGIASLYNDVTGTIRIANSATVWTIGHATTQVQTVDMFGGSTAASTYRFAHGATLTGTTKTIEIGTNGVANSSTNITIGSTVASALGTTTIGGSTLTASTPTTVNLGTSTTAATTVKVGGAFTGNTLKIAGTAAGTINLTTDVTTGAVSVFPSLTTATMTIGSAAAGTVAIAFNKASTSTTTGALTVAGGVGINGALNALTKSFVIPHPTKKGKLLRHGSLEGPEFGVYVRGRCTGNIIELPEYWTGLVDENTITVDLTPIGKHQKLYVEKIEGNKVYIANDAMFGNSVNCFYTVWGERKDVDHLDVEVDE